MMGSCDGSMSASQTLPLGTCLNRKYTIRNILGNGGFGITYGGVEEETGVHVAVKEYFPHRLAHRVREQGTLSVALFSEKYRQEFEEGLRHFLDEAEILQELKHLKGIVSVYDFFEENGTAYIVMEYIEGPTLGELVKESGTLSFSEMAALFSPLLLSIWEIHQRRLIHRDISPENLILGTDNRLHLIDFGAAKMNPQERENHTVILKAGYAPAELYIPNGKIGPWTDIYSLCATMYFTLTGSPPMEAIHRMDQEEDEVLPGLDHLLPGQSAVLKKGLALRAANRYANVMKLREALMAPAGPGQEETVSGTELPRERAKRIRRLNLKRRKRTFILETVLSVLLLLVLLVLWRYGGTPDYKTQPDVMVSGMPVSPTDSEMSASPTDSGMPISPTDSEMSSSPTDSGMSASPTDSEMLTSSTDSGMPTSSASPESAGERVVLSMVSVTDMKLKKAKRILKQLDPDINVSTVYVYHETIAAGRVVHQSVVGDTLFTKGNLSSILLTVSKGKEKEKTTAAPQRTPAPTGSSGGKKRPSNYDVKPEDEYTDISLD